MVGEAQLALHFAVQAVFVGVVQVDVKRLEPSQDSEPDAPGTERPDAHALQVVGALHAVGDVPAALTTHS